MEGMRQNEKQNPAMRNARKDTKELTILLHCKRSGKMAYHSGKPLNSFLKVKLIFAISLSYLHPNIQPRKIKTI